MQQASHKDEEWLEPPHHLEPQGSDAAGAGRNWPGHVEGCYLPISFEEVLRPQKVASALRVERRKDGRWGPRGLGEGKMRM
jgi:hypothetical protein